MEFFLYFQIKPLSGPIEGGTLLTIEGSDLGLKQEDVRGKIHIGHVPCELVDYQVINDDMLKVWHVLHEIDWLVIFTFL